MCVCVCVREREREEEREQHKVIFYAFHREICSNRIPKQTTSGQKWNQFLWNMFFWFCRCIGFMVVINSAREAMAQWRGRLLASCNAADPGLIPATYKCFISPLWYKVVGWNQARSNLPDLVIPNCWKTKEKSYIMPRMWAEKVQSIEKNSKLLNWIFDVSRLQEWDPRGSDP